MSVLYSVYLAVANNKLGSLNIFFNNRDSYIKYVDKLWTNGKNATKMYL